MLEPTQDCFYLQGICFIWNLTRGLNSNELTQPRPKEKLMAHRKYALKCLFSPDSTQVTGTITGVIVMFCVQTSQSYALVFITDYQQPPQQIQQSGYGRPLISALQQNFHCQTNRDGFGTALSVKIPNTSYQVTLCYPNASTALSCHRCPLINVYNYHPKILFGSFQVHPITQLGYGILTAAPQKGNIQGTPKL